MFFIHGSSFINAAQQNFKKSDKCSIVLRENAVLYMLRVSFSVRLFVSLTLLWERTNYDSKCSSVLRIKWDVISGSYTSKETQIEITDLEKESQSLK